MCVIAVYEKDLELKFPSPYWGLIFYLDGHIGAPIYDWWNDFHPRIGDYFFILNYFEYKPKEALWFPSPYWGLIFYHHEIRKPYACLPNISVPVLGIIFLS